ncbi:hypothetical protein ACFVMC_23305 [Nocardia sp. NPDC127579]|uniref:hypothetical protein n=1 Tax=Nocardia sp. NPDC127579 TaxID=3345402 RepID=UPI0036288AEB
MTIEYEASEIDKKRLNDNPDNKSHVEIYGAFMTLNQGEADLARADYAKIATEWNTGIQEFAEKIRRSSALAWDGTAARAASTAIGNYANDALNLVPQLQEMSTRVNDGVTAVSNTKTGMPEFSDDPQTPWNPGDTDVLSFIGIGDGDGGQADLEEKAQKWVQATYFNPVGEADRKLPVLSSPTAIQSSEELPNEVKPNSNNPDTGSPGTTNAPSSDNPTTPASTEAPSAAPTSPQSTGVPTAGVPTTGVPTTGVPTTSAPTSPAATNTPKSNVPTTGIPRTGTPGSGVPGSGRPTTATPGTPKTVSGVPGTANPTAASTASKAAGTGAGRGMSGMPGMGGMGNRGGQGSDDDEHQTPDYLIQDRESELIGKIDPALPPGGVIGG